MSWIKNKQTKTNIQPGCLGWDRSGNQYFTSHTMYSTLKHISTLHVNNRQLMSPTSEQLLLTIYYVVIVGNFEVMISHTLSFIYWVIVTKFPQNRRLSQQWSPVQSLPAAFDGNNQHFSQVHCKFSGHIDCKVTRPKAYFNDMRLSTRVWSNWPWTLSKIQGGQDHTTTLAIWLKTHDYPYFTLNDMVCHQFSAAQY